VATTYLIINLMNITLERYLKVVHPFWSRKYLKQWMIYAAMVFAWIAGFLSVAPSGRPRLNWLRTVQSNLASLNIVLAVDLMSMFYVFCCAASA